MLTNARPIFEHVPGSFCDPVGLADQQAQGVVALIVVRYGLADGEEPAGDPPPAEQRTNENSPPSQGGVPRSGEGVLGPIYDAFVAVSGQLLAVARSTPDYRFPVMPAAALARFIEHRDAGRPTFLSLYELSEDDCAHFLETVFYAECLKLHVDGPDSAPLVARQIERSGCTGGILEVNDFSDPAAPRLQLVDLDALTGTALGPPAEDEPTVEPAPRPEALPDALRPHLDGVTGRVLLYDRAKNGAVTPDRGPGGPRAFDLDAAIEQANRLALARRGSASGDDAARALTRTAAELRAAARSGTDHDQSKAVETYLRDRADRPRLVQPDHPHASGLGALVAELQGRGTAPSTPPPKISSALDADGPTDPPALTPAEQCANGNSPPSQGGEPAAGRGGGPSSRAPVPASVRHPFATELDRLRCEVYALFEDAVAKDRAVAHEAHVLAEHAFPSPVPPERTPAYLRALLTDDPPKRWHFFKRQRGKIYEEVAGKLLAFHAAHGHSDDPVVHEVTKLWTRLHR